MKIAVSSRGPSLDDEVDPRFGRAAYILIVDTETLEFEVMDNDCEGCHLSPHANNQRKEQGHVEVYPRHMSSRELVLVENA